MKHLKLFEELQDKPQVGDYIYARIEDNFTFKSEEEKQDAKNRIFQILGIYDQFGKNLYLIEVVPEPNKINYSPWYLFEQHVLCFAPTIEELKLKYKAQKYNL